MLVAYAQDCTLRLFQAVDKSLEGGSPRSCCKLICVCVNPYRKNKSQETTLIAMGLDDIKIGCLCRIQAGTSKSFILVVISRDEYLLSSGNSHSDTLRSVDLDIGVLKVIDIGHEVLEHLVFYDGRGHSFLPQLSAFFAGGGDKDNVQVVASKILIACRNGRFMTEVTVSISEKRENGAVVLEQVGLGLALVCAARGAIVCMIPYNASTVNVRFSAFGMKQIYDGDGRHVSCTICFSMNCLETVWVLNIESTNNSLDVLPVRITSSLLESENLDSEESLWSNLLYSGFNLINFRQIAVTTTDVVVADCFTLETHDEPMRFFSILSFFPRQSTED